MTKPDRRKRPRSVATLETLGRVRLSKHFYMRNFLHSEIAAVHGLLNVPDDPALAIEAGSALCRHLLDPLTETFGSLAIRSAYRSPAVNALGTARYKSCATNEKNRAGHIWDQRDADGCLGATVSLIVPWFATHYAAGRDWRDLAWWIHDHLDYAFMGFHPRHAAFNLQWHERPRRRIESYIAPKGLLLREGADPTESLRARRQRYRDFPPLAGLALS